MSGVTALKSKSETDWNKCCLYRTDVARTTMATT